MIWDNIKYHKNTFDQDFPPFHLPKYLFPDWNGTKRTIKPKTMKANKKTSSSNNTDGIISFLPNLVKRPGQPVNSSFPSPSIKMAEYWACNLIIVHSPQY